MFYRVVFIFSIFLSLNIFASQLEDIKSFEAEFEQVISNSSNKNIVYKGNVFIKNNAKILWKYKEPIVKNVYIIRNIAIVEEPELEQVIYTQLQNDMNLINLIKNSKKISNNKSVARLNSIDYTLHIDNNTIKRVTYIDELENSVEIRFNNIKQNENIEDELFQFFPPEHYDVIRQ